MSYTLRFVHKANSFVEGQCPGGKMCAIGKYRRNVLSLKSTFWAALSGSIFPSLDYFVRFLTRSLSKWPAFYVNFIFLDSLLYLFYIILFLVSQVEDIPSVVETPRRTTFYVSKPRQLEPRRSYQPVRVHQSQSSPSKTDTGNVCNGISVENRQVQEPRAMIIYCSSNSCRLAKSSKNYPQSRCKKQKQKNQNCVKIDAKVISVSPSCPLPIQKAAKLETRQDVMGRFSYLSKIWFQTCLLINILTCISAHQINKLFFIYFQSFLVICVSFFKGFFLSILKIKDDHLCIVLKHSMRPSLGWNELSNMYRECKWYINDFWLQFEAWHQRDWRPGNWLLCIST